MMTSLPLRAAWRDLNSMRWRVIAVMLILGAGFGMFTGIYSAIDSLFGFRDTLYRQSNIAGFELRFSPEDQINLPDWAGIPGITRAEARLLMPGNIELNDGRRLSALVVAVPEEHRINTLLLSAGRPLDPQVPTEIVIDRNLARHYGYQVGDRLWVNVGKDRMQLTVRGIATSSEHLVDGANPNFFLPAKGSLGIVFAPLKLMDQRLGFRLVNSVLFTGPSVAQDLPAPAIDAIVARGQRKLMLEESVPLSRQFGHTFLTLDLNAFKIFTPAIVVIFAASAITILFFLLRQWVSQQRQQLGVLAALGYRRRTIAWRIAGPLLLIALGGLASGIAFAWLLLYGFGHEYATAVGLPAPELLLQPRHVLAASIALLLACAGGALLPLREALAVSPIAAVRDQAQVPPAGHGEAAGRVSDVSWRYAVRAILRRRRISLMTVAAVALALAPALAYFVALRSFETAIVDSFNRDKWTYLADFMSPVWDDELGTIQSVAGVTAVDPFVRGALRFEANGRRESGLVTGVLPATTLRQPEILEGRGLRPDDGNAIVMERKLARSLGLRPGDSLVVDGRLGPDKARLVGTFSGALPGETFASRDIARHWLDLQEQNTGVLIASNASDDLTSALYQDTRVAKVTRRGALVAEVVKHLKEIAGIVYLAAAFSIGVALLFLFTSSTFAFMAREPDFALLEILGFERRTVAGMVRKEVWLLGGLGIVIALPLGFALAAWLNGILGDAWFHIPTAFDLRDPLAIALPALLLLPLVARPVIRRIQAITLVDVLRRRSFG